MQNAKCKMQKVGARSYNLQFAICNLHFAFRPLATILLSHAILSAQGFAAEPFNVVPADGPAFSASLVGVSTDWKLQLNENGKPRTMAARDLVTLGKFVDAAHGTQLLFADGGLLVANLVKSDTDVLTVDSTLFGELKLPLESLIGIVLHPPADPQRRDALIARVNSVGGDADRLILDNGDELTGPIETITKESVDFASRVGKVQIETARIAALAFNPTLVDHIKPSGLRGMIGFSDGSRLMANSMTLDDTQIGVTTTGKQSWKANREHLRALQVFGGRAMYLSDLKPAAYKHIPFLELPWPFYADRNCLGNQLRSEGAVHPKGLGMHSTARLTYSLTGQKRFAAEVCLDAQTGGRGSVTFRVFADSEQLYASPVVRGNMPPVPISVELPEGAKTLSLIVDFAERGDELDHANWLNARLVD